MSLLALSTCLLASPVAAAQDPPVYEAFVLQDPPAAVATQALALNAAGACAGSFFNDATHYFDGVTWDAAGAPTALSAAYGFVEASAIRIRDDGTVLGSGSTDPLEVSHAIVIAPDGTVQTLPSLAGDVGVVSAAFDANDAGAVVGRSALFATPFWLSTFNTAVMWEGGAATDLGSLGGYFAEANRVNGAKTVIGRSNTATSDFARGFVWDPVLGMREIAPAEPGGLGQVADLDEAGRVCGQATLGGTSFACVWDDPDLPPAFLQNLPGDVASYAAALGPDGSLVGTATLAPGFGSPRLWWGGAAHDLNDLLATPLPFALEGAIDVNADGQILAATEFVPGAGILHVVLTPVPAAPELTGEPAAISVAAGGTQTLDLAAGDGLGGSLFVVLGSLSGTSPGVPVGGVLLPLNPDAYLAYTANHPGAPPLSGSFGTLDASGAAQAAFTLPPGAAPGLAGLALHHAYVVVDPAGGAILGASNAVPLDLVP